MSRLFKCGTQFFVHYILMLRNGLCCLEESTHLGDEEGFAGCVGCLDAVSKAFLLVVVVFQLYVREYADGSWREACVEQGDERDVLFF